MDCGGRSPSFLGAVPVPASADHGFLSLWPGIRPRIGLLPHDLRSAGAGRPATVGVAVLRQERRGLFELPDGVQQPVEAEVRPGEVKTPAPVAGIVHQLLAPAPGHVPDHTLQGRDLRRISIQMQSLSRNQEENRLAHRTV